MSYLPKHIIREAAKHGLTVATTEDNEHFLDAVTGEDVTDSHGANLVNEDLMADLHFAMLDARKASDAAVKARFWGWLDDHPNGWVMGVGQPDYHHYLVTGEHRTIGADK